MLRRPILHSMLPRTPTDALKKIHAKFSAQPEWENYDLKEKKIGLKGVLKFWTPPLPHIPTDDEVMIALAVLEPPVETSDEQLDVTGEHVLDTTEAMPDLIAHETGNMRPRELLSNELTKVESPGSIFAPFLVIVQSSGYGKTRTVLELAKSRRVVYLLCNDIHGGWKRSAVVSEFVGRITQEKGEDDKNEVARTFLRAVVKTAQRYTAPLELYQAQFNMNGTFSTFYNDLQKTYTTKGTASETSASGRLIVVFDESNTLTGEDDGQKSAYRCIRAMLRDLNLIGIFLDTIGSMSTFMPENANSDRSTGIGNYSLLVFEIDTFDEFGEFGWCFMGRPLWRMNWEYRHGKSYRKLEEFAVHKLRRQDRIGTDGLMALFLCRFGLIPSKALAQRLVASHMATLIGVSTNRSQLLTTYKSEPILAEASAYHTTYSTETVEDVLKEVGDGLQNQILTSAKGDRGEIAAAAWFGYTLDRLRKLDAYRPLSMSAEVAILSLITEMCSNTVHIEDKVIGLLEGWTVSLTHFCRLGYSPSRSILEVARQRHVGFYMPKGEEGVDFVFAASKLVSPNTKQRSVAAVRVQVKNYKNRITENAKDYLFAKLDVRRCAPVSTFDEEPVSIAFLVQVGAGCNALFCSLADSGSADTEHFTHFSCYSASADCLFHQQHGRIRIAPMPPNNRW